jgi:hypothetical protein
MRLLKVSVSLFVVLTLAIAAFAQTATSSLRGTVMDPKGGVIPGATVSLKNASQGFSRETKTNERGEYQFQQVPPSTYDITATAASVGSVSRKVQLLVSTPATLDLTVKLTASTTVEVTATAPVVNTTDATIGNAFSNERIQALPIQDRGAENLLSLQPGVTYTGPSDNGVDNNFDSRNGAVGGARSDQANLTVDGIDNNDVNNGFAFNGSLRTPVDSIQEFRVTTSNSNAEVGRSSGAQVVVVTKSGSNNWHGSLFEYHRPTFGVANDWFNKQAQLKAGLPNTPGKLIRNTFGGSVGGPIVKDRMFFFFNYEGQRTAETKQTTRIVPSDALRNGFLSYTCQNSASSGFPACPAGGVKQLTPANLQSMDPGCVTNGTCPWGGGPDPAVLALLQQYPHPNTDTVGDGFNFRGFTFPAALPGRLNAFVGKLDLNVTANGNHKLFVRGNLQDDRTTTVAAQFPGDPPAITQANDSKGLALGYTAILSPTLINNLRYGFVRQGLGNAGVADSHFVHLRGLDDIHALNSADRSTFVTVPVNNLQDDVTWSKGKHTVQVGGNWRLIFNNRSSNASNFFGANTNPSWLANAGIARNGGDLDPGAFGFPQVDRSFKNSYNFPAGALMGVIAQFDSVYNQDKTAAILPEGSLIDRHFKANEFETYVQDSWRVKSNLTITGGLRWTLLQPPYETNGNQAAPDVSLAQWFKDRQTSMFAGQPFNQTISFSPSGQANGKKPYWDWSYGNIAPRIAIAYSPNIWQKIFGGPGKSSFRAGYGKYYDHFGEGIVNAFDTQGSFGLSTDITNAPGVQSVDCAPRFTGLFNVPTSPATTDCNGNPVISPAPGAFPVTPPQGTNNGSFAIYWGLDDKLKTPYAHVVDASFTRELPKGFVVETAYVGRFARHLLQQEDLAMPLNLVDPSSGMDYYTAMTLLSKASDAGVAESNLAAIPFWEHFFPGAAGAAGVTGCDGTGGPNPTATQNIYDLMQCGFRGNETSLLQCMDFPTACPASQGFVVGPGGCSPACASINGVQTNGFALFNDQFSSLYAWRSIGTSNYNSAQIMLRHPMTHGLQFDLNYTLSKSQDVGSDAERNSLFTADFGGPGDNIFDSWHPKATYSLSTFDTTHQINANYVIEMPFGKRRHFTMNSIADAFLGGWDLSGVARWTSGFPFTINNGANWATNWELSGNAPLIAAKPKTGTFIDACGNPTAFQIPGNCVNGNRDSAVDTFISDHWRLGYAGESGPRNNFRGPGYFGWDMGLAKNWRITESKSIKFSWDVFNVFNNVRFDALVNQSSIDSSGTFGTYSSTLTSPRKMQFGLRFDF